MTTYQIPQSLGDILGAHHDGNFETVTAEIKAGIGVLKRGTVLASGAGADAGKLVLLAAAAEASAYGVLLDPAVDTAVAFGDGSVTGSVARAGTFRGAALLTPAGINAATLTTRLRELGIFIEGPIVPGATVLEAAAEEAAAAIDTPKGGTSQPSKTPKGDLKR